MNKTTFKPLAINADQEASSTGTANSYKSAPA
jgi:hypothetical protein